MNKKENIQYIINLLSFIYLRPISNEYYNLIYDYCNIKLKKISMELSGFNYESANCPGKILFIESVVMPYGLVLVKLYETNPNINFFEILKVVNIKGI